MKQKTKRAAKKRLSVTSTGKAKHRRIGQAHFNARATGKETRQKHHDKLISPADAPRLTNLLPYL